MSLIVIKRFSTAIDAYIHKAMLENEDIPCFVHDEHINTINPLYSQAYGGIKLLVDHQYLDRANSIISTFENAPLTNDSGAIITCPSCSSTEITSGHRSNKSLANWITYIFSFLLTVYPFYSKLVYCCKSCGTEFNKTKNPVTLIE